MKGEVGEEIKVESVEREGAGQNWSELVEAERKMYIIKAEVDGNRTVKNTLTPVKTIILGEVIFPFYPHAGYEEYRRYIKWDKGRIDINTEFIHICGYTVGSRPLSSLKIDTWPSVRPWFLVLESLAERVQNEGVKKVFERILEEIEKMVKSALYPQ